MPTAAENLRRAFELTELARRQMAEEIAVAHPGWSPREVDLERNQRWLYRAFEGEVFGPHSRVLYALLRWRIEGDQGLVGDALAALEEYPDAWD